MKNIFSLAGKKILVTGASSGIGRQIAITAAQMGAAVIITGRNSERLQETNAMMASGAECIIADLTNEDQIRNLVAQLPKLNGIVFCAGVVEYIPAKFINAEKLNTVFAVNFNSQVLLTQQLIKNKKLEQACSLVYISSISALIGVPATAMYAASKAALNSFVKVIASELAGQKIRANSISPGLVKTPLLAGAAEGNLSADTFAAAEKQYPLGLGEPQDVAGASVFLLSDAAKWITGTTLVMDGGFTLQ